MEIASHNSFTYLRPRCWWMRLLAFTARCQRVSWQRQWKQFGVRLFDLRVRFDKDTRLPFICHGLMRYEGSVYELLARLNNLAEESGEDCYVRVVLESKRPSDTDIYLFKEFCKRITERYSLNFFGGNDRSDWWCYEPHFRFKTPLQDLDDRYSSTTSLFPQRWPLLRYLDDLCPKVYALAHNRRNIWRGTTHDWLFIDFVDIQ